MNKKNNKKGSFSIEYVLIVVLVTFTIIGGFEIYASSIEKTNKSLGNEISFFPDAKQKYYYQGCNPNEKCYYVLSNEEKEKVNAPKSPSIVVYDDKF